MTAGRPDLVLVTGTPRSGTTPVGDTLAAAPRTRTLYEPLNRHVGDRRVTRYFEVPGAGGFAPATVDALVDDVRRLRLRLRPGLFPEDRGPRRLVKRLTGSRTTMTHRLARLDPRTRTLVWKDPFAVFLVERVAVDHGVPVVVTVRPPAAVAASFKRLGWGFDVADLVRRLGPAAAHHTRWLERVELTSPAANAAVLWAVVHDWLLDARDRGVPLTLVDVERVVTAPEATYRALFDGLGLPWHPAVGRHLARQRSGSAPARPRRDRAHVTRRDAAAVNRYWVEVLDADEADQVHAITADVRGRLEATLR